MTEITNEERARRVELLRSKAAAWLETAEKNKTQRYYFKKYSDKAAELLAAAAKIEAGFSNGRPEAHWFNGRPSTDIEDARIDAQQRASAYFSRR